MNNNGRMIFILSFVWLLSIFPIHAQLKCELTGDPEQVQFIDDDLINFIHTLRMLKESTDWAPIIQKEYLDKASPGLTEYLREKRKDVKHFVEAIAKRRKTYESLVNLPQKLNEHYKKIRHAFAKLKKYLPEVVFMPVYFFVGPDPGASGEPSEYGLIIAISELDEDIEGVHLLVLHEMVHVQQALTIGMEEYQAIYGPKRSLLAISLREGAAYFLTLLTGGHTHQEAYDYYVRNEKRLWKRFKAEMYGPEVGDWMWQKPKDPQQPRHLGYIIGSRIVKAYFDNAKDKKKALMEILSQTNSKEFLKKSGYEKRFLF